MNRRPWVDRDPDELAQHLLEHGRRDKPTEGARRRALAKATMASIAGGGLSVASMTSGAAAASRTMPLWLSVKWMAIKWTAVGAATGVVALGASSEWGQSLFSGSAHSTRSTSSATTSAAMRPRNDGYEAIHPPLPVTPANVPPLAHASPPSAQATGPLASGASGWVHRSQDESPHGPAEGSLGAASSPSSDEASPPSVSNREDSLRDELRLLERARVALDAREPTRALGNLDEYAQRFPVGSMGIEASALRIETLLALGRPSAAQALAQAFLARYPKSPAAMRVRGLVAESNAGPAKP